MQSTPPPNSPRRLASQPLVWVALVAVALAALTLAAFMTLHHPAAAPKTGTKESEAEKIDDYLEHYAYEASVSVGADGFNPATIRVKPDTKIFWESKDKASHRLVATPGSKVAKYFGASQPIQPSKPYAARFVETGTYSYHDADHPGFNGVVIVAP
jgi:plastocyanin